MLRLALLSLAALTVSAQGIPPGIPNISGPPVSPTLERYLELTQAQVTQINRLNNEFRQFQAEKLIRTSQVQRELGVEMRRETLDPMAIGLRYVELEAIRREMESEQRRTREAIQETFTPAQRNRLAALQEALRQWGLACEAVQHNLMPQPEGVTGPSCAPIYPPYIIPAGEPGSRTN